MPYQLCFRSEKDKQWNAIANELSEFVNQAYNNKEVNLISAEHITNLIIPILDLPSLYSVCAIKDRNKATVELPVYRVTRMVADLFMLTPNLKLR